jgi:hypothetical protein
MRARRNWCSQGWPLPGRREPERSLRGDEGHVVGACYEYVILVAGLAAVERNLVPGGATFFPGGAILPIESSEARANSLTFGGDGILSAFRALDLGWREQE